MEVNRPKKPGVGSWTALYPRLGTGDVSYLDSVSPEFFEKEKQAIFKRAWLNVGRVEQLPKVGSYFTKELAACDTSIVVVRGHDRKIRAFHNICSYRGKRGICTGTAGRSRSSLPWGWSSHASLLTILQWFRLSTTRPNRSRR